MTKEEKIREKEWTKQRMETCLHEENIEKNGVLICRVCGEILTSKKSIKEKISDFLWTL